MLREVALVQPFTAGKDYSNIGMPRFSLFGRLVCETSVRHTRLDPLEINEEHLPFSGQQVNVRDLEHLRRHTTSTNGRCSDARCINTTPSSTWSGTILPALQVSAHSLQHTRTLPSQQ